MPRQRGKEKKYAGLDEVFQGQYILQRLSINYIAINKDSEKLPPLKQLY